MVQDKIMSTTSNVATWKETDMVIQGGPTKTAPNFSCNNFGKYGPILIMFSLLHSQMN